MKYPVLIKRVIVPPIKCQGIKTKLVPFIVANIKWDDKKGRWIEPFLGSGVVLFNANPSRALASDTNKHIIKFYKHIQEGKINGRIVREFLEENGRLLSQKGDDFYYYIRDRFNKGGDSLDFLFLSRSCFNGVMRFNSEGYFNVPFGHKTNRFSKAYITKIVNQVERIHSIMEDKDWTFECCDWQEAIAQAREGDFIYMDPPYIGRHTDYYNCWSERDAIKLAEHAQRSRAGFALSMWLGNKYRLNEHLNRYWQGSIIRTFSHFYHVGSTESLRNKMIEALAIKEGYAAHLKGVPESHQLALLEERGSYLVK